MNNKDQFVTIWMFAGMLLGLAIGCVIGIFAPWPFTLLYAVGFQTA